jgi:MFS family permease
VQFVDVMTTTLVIASLPRMLADLNASSGAAGLVVPAYAVLFGSLLILGARLGDRFGHLRVLRTGVVGFAVASAMPAVAPSLAGVVIGRCLLGIAAAISVPSALRLLLHTNLSAEPRRRALALWSASGAAAGASGLLLGGLVTDWLGWRALFWLAVPIAGLLLLALRAPRPSPQTRTSSGSEPERQMIDLDLPGALTLTITVAVIIGGATLLQEAGTRLPGVVLLLATGPLVLTLRRLERRAQDPLLPREASAHPNLRIGSAVSFANTATTSSAVTLATLHLQDAAGYTATAAALLLLPFSLTVIAGSTTAPRLLRRTGPRRTAAAGLAMIGVGCAALLATPALPQSSALAVAIAGYGIGLASVAATTVGTDVPQDLQTLAAGLLNTAAQLGTALGVAAVLTTTSLVTQATSADAGAQAGWLLTAIGATATAVLTIRRQAGLPEQVVSRNR